jgi:hypothetical protein
MIGLSSGAKATIASGALRATGARHRRKSGANPVLHVGKPARLRLLDLSTRNPTPTFWLTARTDSAFANTKDTLVVIGVRAWLSGR